MKKYLLFITIPLFLLSLIGVNAKKNLDGKVIVIDPGHGGADPGTIYKDIYESDINLRISLYLKKELEKQGSTVYLTRDGSYDLSSPNATYRKKSDFDNRIKIINNYADYYLSIHLNYLNDSTYYGSQVFSLKDEQKNASIVQYYLNKKLGFNRKNKLIPSDTYMYRRLTVPGLLIECGFLSNPKERSKLVLPTYQQQLAKVIANAITHLSF